MELWVEMFILVEYTVLTTIILSAIVYLIVKIGDKKDVVS